MSGRLGFLIGIGAGYVLGAKAGTERYEQLRRLYDNLVASPAFREASGKAKGARPKVPRRSRRRSGSGAVTPASRSLRPPPRRSGSPDHSK